MRSEAELIENRIEDFNDDKNTVFVAVGENVREMDDGFSMHKILNEYSFTLSQLGVQAGKVWIEANDVETSIVQMIELHRVQWLVMGAASEKLYSKDMLEIRSNKAMYVCQQAPISCQIWFVCKGQVIYTRRNGSTLPHDSLEKLAQSLSAMFLEGPQGLSSSDLQERLGYATKDAEKSKQKAFEESIKRWRAEEDANEVFNKEPSGAFFIRCYVGILNLYLILA